MEKRISQRTPEELAISKRLRSVWDAKKKPLGLTQEKAAEAFGWTAQATVSQYLRGVIPLGLDVGLKFARLLQCPPSDINPDWVEYDKLHRGGNGAWAKHAWLLSQIEGLSDEQIELLESMVSQMTGSTKADE